MNGIISRQLGRRDLVALFSVALVIRLGALLALQPRLGADGVGFLSSARTLAAGGLAGLAGLPLEHAPLYSLFLALALLVPVDTVWLVTIAQAVGGAATAAIVARMTARETESRLVGVCAGVATAVHISFVTWTAYLLSETLFLFLLVITADRLLVLGRARRPVMAALGVAALSLVTITARPTGAAFAVAGLVALVVVARRAGVRAAPVVTAYLAPFAALALIGAAAWLGQPSTPPGMAAARLADWLRSGVQNGLLETETGRATSGVDLDVDPPPIVTVLPPEQRSEFISQGPFAFAARHPEFVAAQSLRKLRMFWTPVLPEYSLAHALVSSTYFLALYVLALLGFGYSDKRSPLFFLCFACVLLFTLTSVITIVDYDQRYRLPAELFLLPMVGIGLARLVRRVLADRPKRVTIETPRPHPLAR